MHIQELLNKKTAVWGIGREGKSVLKLLNETFPGQKISVLSDKQIQETDLSFLREQGNPAIIEGPVITDTLLDFDVVIKSPGISAYRPEISEAREEGVTFTSGSSLWFSAHQKEKIVGITGTKGKSTTAALTGYLLNKCGLNAVVAGNIGTPLLDTYSYTPSPDVWILELSSYQITDLEGRFDIAALVSLFSAHLSWHGGLENYQSDKLRLFTLLKDSGTSILDGSRRSWDRFPIKWEKQNFFNDSSAIHIKDSYVCDGKKTLFPASLFPLFGEHNLSNLCASLSIIKSLGVDPKSCLPFIQDFRGLEHRLEIVGEQNGLTFINDSISTIPEAALAAVRAFSGRPITLLVGGQENGLNWDSFSRELCSLPLHAVVTLPDNGPRIADSLKESLRSSKSPPTIQILGSEDLQQAVETAKKITPNGGVILLSPASPSYGRFNNFEERGRLFKESACA